MTSVWQDLRYAFRMYSRNKAFTLMALLTLAVGIGANIGLFTVVNAVLLRPLPYPEPQRIVEVYQRIPQGASVYFGYPWFRFAERHNRAFEYLTLWTSGPSVRVTAGNSSEVGAGAIVSSDFFRVFDVQPVMGRGFTHEDDQQGAAPVAVIGYSFWQKLFGGDPHVLGRAVEMNGEIYSIIGIMRQGFNGGTDADIWTTFRKTEAWSDHSVGYLVTGRLHDGVTLEGAQNDLDRVWELLRQEHPDFASRWQTKSKVTTYLEYLVGDYRTPMLLLSAAAACMLLVASVNAANLFLARAIGRRTEMAIRVALGNSRGGMIRQLLTESLLLATASGMAGLLLAALILHLLQHWFADQLNRGHSISMDSRVALFGMAATLLTGLAFGLVPAFQAARTAPVSALRDYGVARSSRASRRFRSLLITSQIGLSTAVLVAAGLLLASFEKLRNDDLGFAPQGILSSQISLTNAKFQSTAPVVECFQRMMEHIGAIPGVQSTAVVNILPTDFSGRFGVTFLPDPIVSGAERVSAEPREITPHYFDLMHISLHSGRLFTDHDTAQSQPVVIVNEAFVRKYLRSRNPIGQHLALGRGMGPDFADQPREIVGVVADTRGDRRMQTEAQPSVYTPLPQLPDRTMAYLNGGNSMALVVRTASASGVVGHDIHEAILKADPTLAATAPRALEEIVDAGISKQKAQTTLLTSFAIISLLLTASGLFGTMSQMAAERSVELGIRSALGATGGHLLWLMLRYTLSLLIVGVVVGLATATALQRFIASYLFGVRPTNLAVFVTVPILLAGTALAATFLPALRATRVDPKALFQQ